MIYSYCSCWWLIPLLMYSLLCTVEVEPSMCRDVYVSVKPKCSWKRFSPKFLLHSTHHLMEARQLTQSQNVSICNCWPTHCDLSTIIQWTIELDLSKWRQNQALFDTNDVHLIQTEIWFWTYFLGKPISHHFIKIKSMESKIKRVVLECRPPSPDVPSQSLLWWVTGLCCHPGLSHGDQDYSCIDFKLSYNILAFTPIG